MGKTAERERGREMTVEGVGVNTFGCKNGAKYQKQIQLQGQKNYLQ